MYLHMCVHTNCLTYLEIEKNIIVEFENKNTHFEVKTFETCMNMYCNIGKIKQSGFCVYFEKKKTD